MRWHSDLKKKVSYEHEYKLPKYFNKVNLSCQVHYIFSLIDSIDQKDKFIWQWDYGMSEGWRGLQGSKKDTLEHKKMSSTFCNLSHTFICIYIFFKGQ